MPQSQFDLLIQPPNANAEGLYGSGEPHQTVAVPQGVSYLAARPTGELELTNDRPASCFVALEPIRIRHRPMMVLLQPNGLRVRLNGQIAPCVAVIGHDDQLLVEAADGHSVQIAKRRRPSVQTVPPGFLGQICPVCRTPFLAGQRVWICDCEQPLHNEPPERGEDRLECARLPTHCPICNDPIALDEDEGKPATPLSA
jgi:hypothetical protein